MTKSILGDLIFCPICKKEMKIKNQSLAHKGCLLICHPCNFEKEVIFPSNVGGFIGNLDHAICVTKHKL